MSGAEEWRPAVGYDGQYEVSNLGRVRSWTPLKRGGLMKTHVSTKGYVRVAMKGRLISVHRLVLEAFVGPSQPGQVCRHLNGRRTDNRPENLRWGTPAENSADMRLHGTHGNTSKTSCHRGHPYDDANTVSRSKGWRECRECQRIGKKVRRDRSLDRPALPQTGKRTHCPHGHPYDEVNTRISPRGARYCRACSRARTQAATAARRAAKAEAERSAA